LRFRRWLVVTQYYAPEPGAPQIRLRELVLGLRRHGADVRVLTAMPNYPDGIVQDGYRGKRLIDEERDSVPVRRLWLFPASGKHTAKRLANYLTFTAHALTQLRQARDVDIVFVESQPITLAFYGLVASRLYRVPFIYNTPDLQVEIAGERNWIGKGVVRIAARLERYLMAKSFCVSTVTNGFIDHLANRTALPREHFTFLPNGVDINAITPLPYDTVYAQKMGVVGKRVFTYAGTHADYQGLDVILDAAKLLTDCPDVVFLLAGKGPERARLQMRAQQEGLSNVLFRVSPFDEAAELFSISHAFVATLRDFPVARLMRLSKTFPPLAAGVPVIFSGLAESADIIEDAGCGIATPPGDAKALANAVRDLAHDDVRRAAMSERAVHLARTDFAWNSIVDRWLQELDGVALPPGSRLRLPTGETT
jgi:colanic acid biosynthesis glycosyl transferase WcaI